MSETNEKLELDLRRAAGDLTELADTLRQIQHWPWALGAKLEDVTKMLEKYLPRSKK